MTRINRYWAVLYLLQCFACGPSAGTAEGSASGTGNEGTTGTGQLTASDTGSPFACAGATWLDKGLIVDDTTSLDSLRDIGGIRGHLEIVGTSSVDDLEFLSCLEIVVGNVDIIENSALTSLHGLERLRVIGGTLVAEGEIPPPDLESNGGISMLDNASLVEIGALTSLERTSITLAGNQSLIDIDLPGAKEIDRFILGGCPDGGDLDGNNAALANFGGFEQLAEIRWLSVFNQTEIVSLDSLRLLTERGVVFKKVAFAGNPQLEAQEIEDFAMAADVVVESCANKDQPPCENSFCYGE